MTPRCLEAELHRLFPVKLSLYPFVSWKTKNLMSSLSILGYGTDYVVLYRTVVPPMRSSRCSCSDRAVFVCSPSGYFSAQREQIIHL